VVTFYFPLPVITVMRDARACLARVPEGISFLVPKVIVREQGFHSFASRSALRGQKETVDRGEHSRVVSPRDQREVLEKTMLGKILTYSYSAFGFSEPLPSVRIF
jgi:hypothetical protein